MLCTVWHKFMRKHTLALVYRVSTRLHKAGKVEALYVRANVAIYIMQEVNEITHITFLGAMLLHRYYSVLNVIYILQNMYSENLYKGYHDS